MLLMSMTAVENGVSFMKIQRHLEQTSSGRKSLQEDGFRAFLTESIQAFCTNEYVKKLVNLSSTERNENLNHVIAS